LQNKTSIQYNYYKLIVFQLSTLLFYLFEHLLNFNTSKIRLLLHVIFIHVFLLHTQLLPS